MTESNYLTNLQAAGTFAENESRAERDSRYRSTFFAVQSRYSETHELPALCAVSIDPDSQPSRKLSYTDIEYRCDVERITTRVLNGRLDLQAAWFSLAEGTPAPPTIAREVVAKCGRAYAANGLEPQQYFRRTNLGSAVRRTA